MGLLNVIMPTVETKAWFIPFQAIEHPRLRLFCFANAGGSPMQFRSWQNLLPQGIEVCPVQLPGQGSRFREQPATRLSALMATLLEVSGDYFDVPYAFWGYSMGALVAFELARTVQRMNAPAPRQLFLAARRAPHTPAIDSPIHRLPEARFIKEIQRRYNGIPAAVLQEPDLMALFLPVLRANFEMIETHTSEATDLVDCPITAFGGLSDPTVDSMAIAAWGELTTRSFEYFMFPGDHFFIQNHQPAIMQILSKNLKSVLI